MASHQMTLGRQSTRMQMTEPGPIREPLYARVARELAARIQQGEFEAELPSQDELCQLLGVSRSTVREAVRILERQGLVVSRQGSGTVVYRESPLFHPGIEELFGTTELIRRSGYASGTSWLDVRRLRATRQVFPVFDGRTVVAVERVRTADGKPFVMSTDVVPDRGWSVTEMQEAMADGSLIQWLEEQQMLIAYASADLTAEAADELLAERLEVAPGSPLLMMEEVLYTAVHEPVMYSQDFYRTDRIHFHLLRRRGG